jgi:poly(3-hydroxybutyrate) depolymerase
MLNLNATPSSPVAIMHIHGDDDMILPHTGNQQEGFQVPAVDEVLKKWIDWDSCLAVPSVLKYDSLVTALQWKGNAEVRLYLIHGLGHDWPTKDRGGWPATDFVWEFFKMVKKE